MKITTAARLALAAPVALGLATLSALPAEAAARSYSFRVETSYGAPAGEPYSGKARNAGEVRFTGKKSLRVTGKVNDICPADGFAAYGAVLVITTNGSRWHRLATDDRGCQYGPRSYARSFSPNANVLGVRLYACEEEVSIDDGVIYLDDCKRGRFIDNPRT